MPLHSSNPRSIEPLLQPRIERSRKHQPHHRNRQQTRHPRHSVVDPRSHTRPALIDRTHHRCGQRSHAHRQPEAKHNYCRKHFRPIRPTPRSPPRPASISENVIPHNPTVASAAPHPSSLRTISSSRLSGTRAIEIATTSTAKGTLIKNTHRHEKCSMSHPPTTGPSAAVI